MEISDRVTELATIYAQKNDSDVLIYSGELEDNAANAFVQERRKQKHYRKNVLLILVTPGGSAAAAYRMARCLQGLYRKGKFVVFVSGWCKSAGTLLVVGAHNVVIGDFGELGPLDVQLGKQDEIFEYNSGLIIDSALDSLESRAISMFEKYFLRIKIRSGNRITFKTATHIASNMVVNLLTPVYNQIDPIKIGENAREMSVASDYGSRLNEHSQNLKSRRSLSTLVESYSSHGFVIDRTEASEIFLRVSEPDAGLRDLEAELGEDALIPEDDAFFGLLSDKRLDDGEGENEGEDNASHVSDQGQRTNAEIIEANFRGAASKDGLAPDETAKSSGD